jgi:hypothetical protein
MFARRLRTPTVLLWVVGLALAALVGLAVAGPPGGEQDVPLRDREVEGLEAGCGVDDETCFFGSTTTTSTTSTTAPAPTTTTAPVTTTTTTTGDDE